MEPFYVCFPMSLEGSWVKSWLLWIDDDKKSLRTLTDSYKWQSEVQIRGPLENHDVFQNMASTLQFWRMTYQSADWLCSPKFWGKNNCVVCPKVSICLLQYFASEKHWAAPFMLHCFEVIGWCMPEGMTPKWTKQGNYPGDPPWSSLMNWTFLHWERGKKRGEDCFPPKLRNIKGLCTHGPFQIQENFGMISPIVSVIPFQGVSLNISYR